MPLLTAEAFRATAGQPHVAVDLARDPPFDFWAYYELIPIEDFGGHDFSAGQVSHAWTTRGGTFQHVLVGCDRPNVFLALVLDLRAANVLGHHVLDLHEIYGLN